MPNNSTTTSLINATITNTNNNILENVEHLALEEVFGLDSCCSTWCETFKVNALLEELMFFNDSYTESERRCMINDLSRYNMLGGCK